MKHLMKSWYPCYIRNLISHRSTKKFQYSPVGKTCLSALGEPPYASLQVKLNLCLKYLINELQSVISFIWGGYVILSLMYMKLIQCIWRRLQAVRRNENMVQAFWSSALYLFMTHWHWRKKKNHCVSQIILVPHSRKETDQSGISVDETLPLR